MLHEPFPLLSLISEAFFHLKVPGQVFSFFFRISSRCPKPFYGGQGLQLLVAFLEGKRYNERSSEQETVHPEDASGTAEENALDQGAGDRSGGSQQSERSDRGGEAGAEDFCRV